MPDCFISYASPDLELARCIKEVLEGQNLSVFMAADSIAPGESWSDEIWKNLRSSKWIVFLASKAACESPYVQQELGGALHGQKKLVPIIWDMPPEHLPGWANQSQVLDLRNANRSEIIVQVDEFIAKKIAKDKFIGACIAGAVIFALLYFGSKK